MITGENNSKKSKNYFYGCHRTKIYPGIQATPPFCPASTKLTYSAKVWVKCKGFQREFANHYHLARASLESKGGMSQTEWKWAGAFPAGGQPGSRSGLSP